MQGRTGQAKPSSRVPTRQACPASSLGRSVPSGRAALLVPIETSLAPDVSEGDEQDAHEDKHLDEAEPLELPHDHRPRVEEHSLDVEDDEEHRREVEANGEPAMGRAVRDDAGLVRGQLRLVRLVRAQHEAEGDQSANQTENYQYENQ